MLDTILSSSTTDQALTWFGTLSILISALGLGLVISLVYMLTHRKVQYTASYAITLIMLPAVIAMIILLVGSNVARAFSLAGAFSLIRFRSAPGDSKDIAYVFFTLAVGLACGMGYISYALLFAVVLCLAMLLLSVTNFGVQSNKPMRLKISIPEDMDYNGVFDGVLDHYAVSHRLTKVKTTEFGSLFELTYEVTLRSPEITKALIDDIRSRNGNLAIVLSVSEMNDGFL
jgi:hypothetical protein